MSHTTSHTARFGTSVDALTAMVAASLKNAAQTYPPYNIEKLSDDEFAMTIAAAGFATSELSVEIRDSQLVVSGAKAKAEDEAPRNYIHHGLAMRNFERRIPLPQFFIVEGASHENGLLQITLRRELPEAMKPRKIDIGTKIN